MPRGLGADFFELSEERFSVTFLAPDADLFWCEPQDKKKKKGEVRKREEEDLEGFSDDDTEMKKANAFAQLFFFERQPFEAFLHGVGFRILIRW